MVLFLFFLLHAVHNLALIKFLFPSKRSAKKKMLNKLLFCLLLCTIVLGKEAGQQELWDKEIKTDVEYATFAIFSHSFAINPASLFYYVKDMYHGYRL